VSARACLHVDADALHALRETLALSQSALANRDPEPRIRHDLARLQVLIAEIDRNRPLGTDGTHGDLHTPTCGCEDAPTAEPAGRWYYGAVMSEPGERLEIASSGSAWHYEPYRTLEAVRDDWPDREYVRSWHPSAQDWEPVP
jgi:hypothetical protein